MSGWIRGVRAEDKARVQDIEERVAELAGHLNALHGELAVLVGELHGLGGCGDLSPARWLSWRLGCSGSAAGAVAAVAERVEELPVTVGRCSGASSPSIRPPPSPATLPPTRTPKPAGSPPP